MKVLDLLRAMFGRETSRSSKSVLTNQGEAPEAPTRLLQIGIDFGTCWSKIVVRDYEAARALAFVVRPIGRDKGPANEYRIPSAVTLYRGELFFGWPGHTTSSRPEAAVYHSVKMRAAYPQAAEYQGLPKLPKGLTADDMAILVVTYLLQIASEAAVRYCGAQKPRSRPKPGVSMGVPMGLVADPVLHDRFLAIIRCAFELIRMDAPPFSAGLAIGRASELLQAAKQRVKKSPKVQNPRDWLRSEAEAGLLWVFQSPRVKPGLYACVDVGAGTTDVSVFRIAERYEDGAWQKARMGFYSAASNLPGIDAIDNVVSAETGAMKSQLGPTLADWLGKLSKDGHSRVSDVTNRIHEVHRKCWAEAFSKDRRESAWQDYGLFALGGGSKVAEVRDALARTVWVGRLSDRQIIKNEFPPDLFEFHGGKTAKPFADDATFMLVAYGLSFMGSDAPPVDAPEVGADYTPPQHPRRSFDQDEFYPK